MSTVTAVPLQPSKRSVLVYVWLGVAIALFAALWLAWRGTAEPRALKGDNATFLAWNRTQPGVIETKSGLQYKILKAGDGPNPTDSDIAGVTFLGRLRDGTVFQEQPPQPVPLPLSGGAIPGVLEGIKLMNKGARYRFWLKPELGYGSNSPDPARIPANALLIFDIDLAGFISQAQMRQMQMQQMMQQQGKAGGASGVPGGPPVGQ